VTHYPHLPLRTRLQARLGTWELQVIGAKKGPIERLLQGLRSIPREFDWTLSRLTRRSQDCLFTRFANRLTVALRNADGR